MGVHFAVLAPAVPEERRPGESPEGVALRLSLEKALAVAAEHRDQCVIAADTIVVADGAILGKPRDADDALRMLLLLRGRPHCVQTGVTIVHGALGTRFQELATTLVVMENYPDAAMAAYVASGDPLDKAGAYAIQAQEFSPVARYEGCYTNVVGLPMCHVYRGLRALQMPVPISPLDCCPLAVSAGCPWADGILSMPVVLTRAGESAEH